MRLRALLLAAALSAGFAPQKGVDRPIVAAGRAPRIVRAVRWSSPAQGPLAGWRVQWDHDTNVPLRMWGPGLATPGAMTNADAAESAARQFLAAHLDVLSPGATAADYVLVANQLNPTGDVRTVAFAQRVNGVPVVGGAIGFAFKADRLVLVSSTALPGVAVRMPGGTLPAQTIAAAATSWLAQSGHDDVVVRDRGDRVIVPIVHARGNAAAPDIEYRVAETVRVETTRLPGRWDVWIDASDASPIARVSLINYTSGKIMFNVPDRYPLGTRGPKAAALANVMANGTMATTGVDGSVTWATTGAATVVPGLSGMLETIINKAGALATTTLSVAANGTATWDLSADEKGDAQLDSFVFEHTVKQFVLTKLNPGLTWAMQQIAVNVNESQTCNAYSTGDDIHFFVQKPGSGGCENTGRMSDVVFHETGHSVHANSIIPGAGQFDGSLSEGLADTMAASITGDHGMGRGFFFTDAPLRDLQPAVKKVYPQDYDGEPHDDGEIIGEALWDTRMALQAKLGPTAGFDQFLKIYYGIMQRASDIPSSYAEALLADDDNGNLSDGTPNMCDIQAAFAGHGLADPSVTIGLTPPVRDNYNVSFTVMPPSGGCTVATVQGAVLDWNPRGGGGGSVTLTGSGNTWSGAIPSQPDNTVVEYKVTVTLSDGSTIAYPQNPADPKYQFYVGPVTPIKCFDFEAGAADWTHTATPSANDEWASGAPMGVGGDPKTAHGGSNVFGIDLGADDGMYSPRTMTSAESPEIDLGGMTNVRLQYWRWLGVEDGAYDHAQVFVNDQMVWTNFMSPGMPTTDEVNHVDKEWRFQDVDLSTMALGGKVKLKFALSSDPGLELGGWTLDDVCIVAIGAAAPTCGNNMVEAGETCDDGNTTDGDGCSATCQSEDATGMKGGGCCDTGGTPGGAAGLSLLVLGLVLRRRSR